MNAFSILLITTSLLNVLLIAIGPAFVGYGIALLILGRRDPHVPTCSTCSVALSRETLAGGAGCPSCGSTPLVAAPARTSARWRGILLIVAPIVSWIALMVLLWIFFAATL